jgi:hypothetical protein
MKIAQNDLKVIYRDYIRGQMPSSSDQCVDEERWKGFFGGRLSHSSKGKLIDHMTHCATCTREFELLLDMERSKNALVAEIGNLMDSEQEPPESTTGPPNPFRRLHFRWKYGLVCSGVVVLSMVLAMFFIRHPKAPSIPDVTRGNQPIEIELQSPLDESKRKQSLEFKWKSRESFDTYIIEIYDDSLRQIWQSPLLTKSRLTIPKEIFDSLEIQKTYYWMVTGTLRTDRKLESRLAAFKLNK